MLEYGFMPESTASEVVIVTNPVDARASKPVLGFSSFEASNDRNWVAEPPLLGNDHCIVGPLNRAANLVHKMYPYQFSIRIAIISQYQESILQNKRPIKDLEPRSRLPNYLRMSKLSNNLVKCNSGYNRRKANFLN